MQRGLFLSSYFSEIEINCVENESDNENEIGQ